MSEKEKIQMVEQLISDMSISQEDIRSYLALSTDRIFKRIWPFGFLYRLFFVFRFYN